MDEIELPTTEVRQWIARAACDCGYPEELAELLGYSAWWLENRSMKGVSRAVTYLLMIQGRPFSALEAKSEGDRLVCLCPMLCGLAVTSQAENDPAKFADWVGGFATADPMLMVPIVAQGLDYKFDVFLRFHDQEMMFTQGGATLFSESLATLFMLDARKGVDAAIRLVGVDRNSVSAEFEYRKRDTLKVPKFRYLTGGGFRFD